MNFFVRIVQAFGALILQGRRSELVRVLGPESGWPKRIRQWFKRGLVGKAATGRGQRKKVLGTTLPIEYTSSNG
jgi:hypothetical protein